MNRIVFTVLFSIIASAALARANGINAKKGEFKYQAMFYHVSGSIPNAECGGAIINEWYVLTNAHCVGTDLSQWELYFGTIYMHEKQQKRIIAEIKFPGGSTEKRPNIALVRTTERIEFSANVQPIALAASADVYGGILVSSGFGIRVVS